MRLLPSNKTSYPINPGVYRMLDKNDKIIYIGKAKNLKNRLSSYFDSSSKSARIKLMIAEIMAIEVTSTDSENDALVLEQKLITKIKPKYNIIFRDDKSYPFISISQHIFPKVYISREKNTKSNRENLFGPYPKKEDAYKNVEYIQQLFKLRTCTDNEFSHRSRPCILHSIGKCSAPCVNQENKEFKDNYEYNVSQAKKLLQGKVHNTISSLKERMSFHSEKMEYEQAAQIRDTINSLNDLTKQQTVFSLNEDNVLVFNYIQSSTTYLGYTRVLDGVPQEVFDIEIKGEMLDYSIEELLTKYIENEVVKHDNLKIISPLELKDLFYPYQYLNLSKQYKDWLNLVKDNLKITIDEQSRVSEHHQSLNNEISNVFIPYIASIDCIDISHFNGEATYGGKIRWSFDPIDQSSGLDKSFYRLSRFPGMVIDDVKHMRESVDRIYHEDNDFPTILLIDGDIPQLEAAYDGLKNKNLTKDYILMSSAKGASRKKGVEIFHIHPTSLKFINPLYLKNNVLDIPKDSLLRFLLQNIQDTAHDFSNSARKKRMSKDRFDK